MQQRPVDSGSSGTELRSRRLVCVCWERSHSEHAQNRESSTAVGGCLFQLPSAARSSVAQNALVSSERCPFVCSRSHSLPNLLAASRLVDPTGAVVGALTPRPEPVERVPGLSLGM